jgi:GntR family transcriptional regulator
MSAKRKKDESAAGATAVAKNLPVPLYHQIYLLLRDEIISGQRPFGTLVPTEQELSRIYGVSRITTRRALDELAQNHLVARKRRVGTRVIFQPPSPPIQASIEHAVESLLALGRSTKAKLVEMEEEEAEAPITDALKLRPHEKVIRAMRVRWLDDQPLGCIISYVPSRLGKKFTRAELESTPMLSLLEKAGLKIDTASQTISATSADAQLADLLDVEIRAPLLRISRTVCNAAGEAILLTLAHYRSDRYQISLDLHSFSNQPAERKAGA